MLFDRYTDLKRTAMFGAEHVLALVGFGALAATAAAPTSAAAASQRSVRATGAALYAVMAGVAPTFYLVAPEYLNRYAGPVRPRSRHSFV